MPEDQLSELPPGKQKADDPTAQCLGPRKLLSTNNLESHPETLSEQSPVWALL